MIPFAVGLSLGQMSFVAQQLRNRIFVVFEFFFLFALLWLLAPLVQSQVEKLVNKWKKNQTKRARTPSHFTSTLTRNHSKYLRKVICTACVDEFVDCRLWQLVWNAVYSFARCDRTKRSNGKSNTTENNWTNRIVADNERKQHSKQFETKKTLTLKSSILFILKHPNGLWFRIQFV